MKAIKEDPIAEILKKIAPGTPIDRKSVGRERVCIGV